MKLACYFPIVVVLDAIKMFIHHSSVISNPFSLKLPSYATTCDYIGIVGIRGGTVQDCQPAGPAFVTSFTLF